MPSRPRSPSRREYAHACCWCWMAPATGPHERAVRRGRRLPAPVDALERLHVEWRADGGMARLPLGPSVQRRPGRQRADQAGLLPFPVAFLLGFALVELLLPFGEADALDAAFDAMEVQGHQRKAGRSDLADQLGDLLGVQQLAGAVGSGLGGWEASGRRDACRR